MRRSFSTHSEFEKISGYSRMIDMGDDWVLSAGTTGFNYDNMSIADSLEEQVEQTFSNIKQYLARYDATLDDVVVCNWIITQREFWLPAGTMVKEYFATSPNHPVMMTLICDLIDPRMKFEMQVFAKRS